MDDDLSAAERQMIVILREWAGEPGTYRLTAGRHQEILCWTAIMTSTLAWDNV